MNDITKILAIAEKRLQYNRDLITKLRCMDAMNHTEWAAPWTTDNPKPSWWRDMPTSQPAAAIKAATRMFASEGPTVKITPLMDKQKYKERCNDIESALMWQYSLLASRGEDDVTYTLIEHAMLYAKICFQVIYLPWQNKINEQLGAKRWNVQGDFAWSMHHPANVHENISNLYGLQDVLLIKDMTADDIVASWGEEHASKVKKKQEEDTGSVLTFRTYDWTDDGHRVFMCQEVGPHITPPRNPTDASVPTGLADPIVVYSEVNKEPFLNWVVRRRGSSTETDPAKKIAPLLNSLYEGDKWNSINFWRSMMRSDTIATALMPKRVNKTNDREAPEESFDTPGGSIDLYPNESSEVQQPPILDPRMKEFMEQDASEIGESTVPRIIADPGVEQGVSFASTNQMYSAAESTLDPFRKISQWAFSDGFKLMLMWKMHTGDPLNGFEMERSGRKSKFTGRSINIPSETIPVDVSSEIATPQATYLEATLTASNPLDQSQELNVLNMMRQAGFPDEIAYEQMGYHNPQKIVRGRYHQQLVEAKMQMPLKKAQAEADAQALVITGRANMKLQQEMMQAQQGGGQQPPPPDTELPDQSQAAGMVPPNVAQEQGQAVPNQLNPAQAAQQAAGKATGGVENAPLQLQAMLAAMQGQGFSPGEGGQSPLDGAPGALTKEAVTGKARPSKPKKGKK